MKYKKLRPNKGTQTRWPFSRGKFADLEAEEVGGSGEEEDEGFDEDRDHVRTSIYSTLSDSKNNLSIGLSPVPVTVTTRIITFIGGDPYKPSFATVTGRGTTQLINLFFFLLVKIAYRSGMFFQKIQRHVCDFWLVTGVH